MAEKFQRVEPTPFSTPEAAPITGAVRSSAGGSPNWLWPALAVLLALALAVIFLLPRLVSDPTPATEPASGNSAASGSASQAVRESAAVPVPGEAASPFADAVEAKARAAAQDLLAELLDVRENLGERGAESWAPEAMANIAAAAEAGDTRYRERDFEAALGSYETALNQALTLEQSVPVRFDAQLTVTAERVEKLDPEGASTALTLAELLQPGDPALPAARARVEALPSVMEAVDSAQAAEQAGDLTAAATALQAAAKLDEQHQRVAAELARISEALNTERFNRAMSEGYIALESSQFDRAQQRFERAAQLRRDSTEAPAALRELSSARTAATLRALKSRGEQLLESESWKDSIDVFEEALAIDTTLRFARKGLARAKPRAELTAELSAILDSPDRLVDDAILSEAKNSLQRAQRIDEPGPKLAAQTLAVERTLEIASQPVAVALRSDGLTTVTVYKVARLGEFSEQRLSLRPGTYTAVGTRLGYRDVRRQFTVTGGGVRNPVTIVCSELI